MQRLSNRLKSEGRSIGFVPTMGYLHKGHLSLVERSVKENDFTIASIFVNPIQFGPKEDFKKYPRDFKRDESMLKRAGVDALFYPAANRMYPDPYHGYVEVEELGDTLCGKSRPGHFKGVATVVTKLFNIVKPDIAYFGQKDAQQALIIDKMSKDLNMGIKIRAMPTVREKDGLAMSSRNTYLGAAERKEAAVLYKSLLLARQMINRGERSAQKIINRMKALIKQKKAAAIDYVEIVDAATLKPVKNIAGDILIALAVRIGNTRLIDNIKIRKR
jgi:pantoate--beta-alanine ligase